MIDPNTNRDRENAEFWTLSKFGGLDQLDWLMILVSVLIGTIAKQHHFLQLPDGFLEWVLPFLLMMAGYKARGEITEIIEVRRAKAKQAPNE
jgi:uncharacterized membrane protein YbjE (DUF340 family)